MRPKLFRARALLLVCGFCVRFVWCQDISNSSTIISSCRPGDNKCSNNVINDSERNTTNSASISSSSSLPSDEVKPSSSAIENDRGRAMNFTSAFQGDMRSNGLETGLPMPVTAKTNNKPTNMKEHSIDDVSMDDMDDEYNTNLTSIMTNMHLLNDMMSTFHTPNKTVSSTAGACMDLGKVYKLGEKFNKGCDETCQCLKNGVVCSQLCKPPYHTKGRNRNAECTEEAIEGNTCCVTIKCMSKTNLDAKPVEGCTYKNDTYKPGTTFKDGCESICTCEDMGRVSCKNRCRPMPSDEDNCVSIVDPKDSCCTIVLCDVEEHANKMETTVSDDPSVASSTTDNQIISARALNSSSVALTFAEKSKDCRIEASINGVNWENMVCVNNIVTGLQPGKKYQFKLKNIASNKVEVILPPVTSSHTTNSTSCTFKGKTYKIGEEFNDGCEAFCVCEATGVECAPIECPTDFGLDVLDPQCLEWETFPANFTPTPPQCCPEKVQCRFNGSCVLNGETFPNWAELPVKVTGCEKRCYCEMSNITCQPMCLPVPETPPKNLHCPSNQAILMQSTENECCNVWTCPNVARPGNDSMPITPVNKPQQTTDDTLDTHHLTSSTHSPDITKQMTTKPNTDSKTNNNSNKDLLANSHKNTTINKKEFYPGPFSPQYISKNENSTSDNRHQKPAVSKKPSHNNKLTDLLSPFHLDKFADQIDKELHATISNGTDEKDKKIKKPIKPLFHNEDGEEHSGGSGSSDVEEESYDEKPQEEDLFTDVFESKNKNNNKHPVNPFWTVKSPEIPELVKNPHLHEPKPSHPPSSGGGAEFSKKHNANKENTNLYVNKKQKPNDDSKGHEIKAPVDNTANHFIPYAHIPYNIPDGLGYPNINPPLEYPPAEILIHQGQRPNNHPGGGFSHKFKPPPANDPNQSEEFFHVLDNDAYNEDHIRQNLHHYNGHHQEIPAQFQHNLVKLQKGGGGGGIRIQNPNGQDINVDDVLTHLHIEGNNNNNAGVHLLSSGPAGHPPHHHQIQNVQHSFGFPNYPETLNTEQTSHPLLLHPELSNPSANDTNRDEIKMHVIEAIDDTTIKLVFSVPAFLVGLHGRIELQYTSDQSNEEPATWEHQILAPPNDLIATKELEFEFGGLKPNTTYKIKIKVMMDDIDNAPTSPILMIRTLSSTAMIASTPMPPIIPVEPDLRVLEVNSTYAKIGWRMFSDFELQFIDGVQIRYKEIDDKIYAATPLIHRAVTTYTLEELQPDSIYEVGIYFIPFPGQTTELQAQKTIQIRTAVENDPYKFEIIMDVHHIKTTSVEISWTGIPYPEDKHVNIFRAIYQSEGSREDSSSFKVAKRDSPQSILIQDLKPATRYRLWLEAYLTNGRTKKSNVKDFITKLGPASSSTSQGKLEGMALVESNSYYGPLVVVAIVATIAVMANVILLLILAKKHGTNKAPITSPINRKNNTSAAYDNPTYKTCENDRLGNNNTKVDSITLTVFPKTHVEKEA